jgi:hypothetical protein
LQDQTLSAQLDPPLGYKAEENGGRSLETWDMFKPDQRLGLFGGDEPSKTVQSLLPSEVTVTAAHREFVKDLEQAEEAQLGLNDVGNLANLKINLNSEAADKQLESIGPIAKGIAMRIEKANKRIGERMKVLVPQYMDASRLIEYVGPDNIAKEMFDYNPDDMVPSHLPDELGPNGSAPTTDSMYDRLTRAKFFVKKLRLISVPSTLLKITQAQEQLKYLQLKRTPDCPISWETTFTKLDVPNPKQEMEKYFKEQMELTKRKLIAAAMAQKEMQELGLQPPGGDEGGGGKGKGGGKGGSGGFHAGGRPPSNSKQPKIAQKGGAGGDPRTTVKTS